MTAFTRQSMHQPPRVFVHQPGRFYTAVAKNGPSFFSQFTHHHRGFQI
jgi:hypothetical protein